VTAYIWRARGPAQAHAAPVDQHGEDGCGGPGSEVLLQVRPPIVCVWGALEGVLEGLEVEGWRLSGGGAGVCVCLFVCRKGGANEFQLTMGAGASAATNHGHHVVLLIMLYCSTDRSHPVVLSQLISSPLYCCIGLCTSPHCCSDLVLPACCLFVCQGGQP